MHDVNSRVLKQPHEVAVVPDLAPALLRRVGNALLGTKHVGIAHSDKTGALESQVVFRTCDHTVAYQRTRQLI